MKSSVVQEQFLGDHGIELAILVQDTLKVHDNIFKSPEHRYRYTESGFGVAGFVAFPCQVADI